jgi:hypothetical protein
MNADTTDAHAETIPAGVPPGRTIQALSQVKRPGLPKSSLRPKMDANLNGAMFYMERKPFSSWDLVVARIANRHPFRR